MSRPNTSLQVRVIPNASRNEIVGWQTDGCLKLKVRAPAEGGRANKEVCAFLARSLGLGRRSVTLVSGEKSRLKMIAVEQMSEAAVKKQLGVE